MACEIGKLPNTLRRVVVTFLFLYAGFAIFVSAKPFLFVFKAKSTLGLGTLISSKVSQGILLVGMIPVIFCISSGKVVPMMIDERQIEEIFLTSAQSAFAVALLSNLHLSVKSAVVLFILLLLN